MEIQLFSLKKMHFKMSSMKWQAFCCGLNVLQYYKVFKNPWNVKNVLSKMCSESIYFLSFSKVWIWNHERFALFEKNYRQTSNIRNIGRQLNPWSLICSWSIACRRCSNYIFILDLTHSFNGLGKDNFKTRRESFNFWDLVQLILETLR